ncbi:MAG: ABC transporter permease subunit [Clostridia bacterium]|nr:ABC transporter permease subunit [Clostridia bacterium]
MKHIKSFFARRAVRMTIAVVIWLGIWQAVSMAVGERILLASPIAVLSRLATIWREDGFFGAIMFSFGRIVGGALVGIAVGCLLAAASSRSRLIEILLSPLMVTVKSVPVASFIVIALIWLSSRTLSIFISFLIVLPVVYSNMLTGLRATPRDMLDMAQVFRLPWYRRLLYIRLPAVKPYLLSACGSALGMAWKAGVAAEVIGLPDGSLGEALYEAKLYFNSIDLLAWTVVIVLISVGFEKLFVGMLKFAYGRLEKI